MSKQNISLARFPARSIGRISPALIRGEHVPYPIGETLLHEERRLFKRLEQNDLSSEQRVTIENQLHKVRNEIRKRQEARRKS